MILIFSSFEINCSDINGVDYTISVKGLFGGLISNNCYNFTNKSLFFSDWSKEMSSETEEWRFASCYAKEDQGWRKLGFFVEARKAAEGKKVM